MSLKNFSKIEDDFVLPDLTYLDNAATTFCPQRVVNKLTDYFTNYKANIHRGSHSLGIKATDEYESVRLKVARLVNAKTSKDVVFTSGTTHSINLIAFGFCNKWGTKDLVIVPESEHHANLLPWVKASELFGFQFKTVNVIKDGSLDLGHLQELLDDSRGKVLFSMAHISNTIGHVQPLKAIFDLIKEFDGITVLDAAQSISKFNIDTKKIEKEEYF
jgi:cysteine desulfurase/selenocysteine lyase